LPLDFFLESVEEASPEGIAIGKVVDGTVDLFGANSIVYDRKLLLNITWTDMTEEGGPEGYETYTVYGYIELDSLDFYISTPLETE